MTLAADANGVVRGKFTIPAGVTSGTKAVVVTGQGGSVGRTTFSGQGTLERQTWQQQTTVQETRWQSPPPPMPAWEGGGDGGSRDRDPLAQTFTLAASTQVAAVDLFFAVKPTSATMVQIRETTAGFPNQNIVAQASIPLAGIAVGGAATTVALQAPVLLVGGVEYALVLMCDDATGESFVAELGKFDTAAQAWVTVQPYNIGVLLSSSNASTWTAHQDKDLTFRLRAVNYTQTTRNVALGKVAVTGATDLLLMSYADRPASATNVEYTLTLPDSSTLVVSDGEPVKLAAPITGNVQVSAKLTGTADFAPILQPGTQLVAGVVATSADYVTRAVPGGSNVKLKVIYEAVVPSGATVRAYWKGPDAGDTWSEITSPTTRPVDDGFVEFSFLKTAITEQTIQVKLVLTGTTAARPRVRDLRVIVTA